jgi:hypothetical protein
MQNFAQPYSAGINTRFAWVRLLLDLLRTKIMKQQALLLLAVVTILGSTLAPSQAQATAFTYQGQLRESDRPANGSYDLRALLYTEEIGGSQIGPIVFKTGLAVTEGLFTTDLDFGTSAFNGEPRWLELAVRRTGAATYTRLDPRQAIRPAPCAQFALTPAGPKGETGAAGPQGEKGEIGEAGLPGPQGVQGAKGDLGPQGPRGLIWRGAWTAAAIYQKDDAVSENGSAWVAISGNTASTPVIGNANWNLLAEKGNPGPVGPKGETGASGLIGPTGPAGSQGIPGTAGAQGPAGATGAIGPAGPRGLNWRGAWIGTTTYQPLDGVTDNGASWVATVPSTGSTPAIGNADWDLLAEKGIAGPAGATGAQGIAGPAGIQGVAGPKGDPGIVGPQGPPGPLKSLNTLTDDVTLLAGANVAIVPNGNTLTISSGGTGGNGIWTLNASDAYFNGGNVGVGTTTPASKLTVRTGSLNPYGIEHSSGAVRLSTYINGPAAWFGTVSDHPLNFFVKDGAPSMTINTDGNVGIGTTASPQARLHVSGDQARLRLESTTLGDAPTTEYVSPAGRWLTGIGGAGGTGNKYFIRDVSAGITRVVVDPIGNVGVGTSTPTEGKLHVEGGEGTAVYASSSSGYAIAADGHATQTREKGGFVKAMVYVKNNTIVRCFNSSLPNGQASAGTCGITLSVVETGFYKVNFGFEVTDRFVVLSPEVTYGGLIGGGSVGIANYYFGDDPNVIEVLINDTDLANPRPFMLVVF